MEFIQLYVVVGLLLSLPLLRLKPSDFVLKLLLMIPFWSVVLLMGMFSKGGRK